MILSRPVAARATRAALIVASVPELTKRTRSIEGTSVAHELGELDFERARRAEAGAEPRLPRQRGRQTRAARGRESSGPTTRRSR